MKKERTSRHQVAGMAPEEKSATMHRVTGFVVGFVGFALVHGVLPGRLSRLGRRNGWRGHLPGRWNLLGLPLVAAGTVIAGWGLVLHSLQGWRWARTQKYFLRRGPYRFSRNPMYVGEAMMWLGWSVFFGSLPVLLGCVTFLVGFSRLIIPGEERALEERFGESYLRYKKAVPRWLGILRR